MQLYEFQFHIGAIKIKVAPLAEYISNMFQFHIGAIKIEKRYRLFNPIK